MKPRLTPEQVRIAQEQKLRAQSIPSKTKYTRKTKHKKDIDK